MQTSSNDGNLNGVGVGLRVGVAVAVGVGVFVIVGVAVADGVTDMVGVGVKVGVEVAVGVGISVMVGVGVSVAVGVALTSGSIEELLFCGWGTSLIKKSEALSSVSSPFPKSASAANIVAVVDVVNAFLSTLFPFPGIPIAVVSGVTFTPNPILSTSVILLSEKIEIVVLSAMFDPITTSAEEEETAVSLVAR